MTGFDSSRGRVWAVLIGLMGGMIIGLPLRPGVVHFGHRCHHHCNAWQRGAATDGDGCPWLKRHPGYVPGADDATPPPCERGEPGPYVTIPPAAGVREIHVAPGVGVRLDLKTGAARDPFHPRAAQP